MRGTRHTLKIAALVAIVTVAGGCASTSTTASPTGPSVPTAGTSVASAAAKATTFEDIEPGTELLPGTHVLNYASIGGADRYPTLSFTFTVPRGWSRVDVDGLVWSDAGVRLLFSVPDNLYVDPCDPARGLRDPAVGPSVADLSTALAGVRAWTVESRASGRFHGFSGDRLLLRSPADVSACSPADGDGPRLLHALGNPGYVNAHWDGERHDLRVLDVDGTRVVVDAIASGDATPAATAELAAIVDSVAIRP
jgi:hypothetical protein